MKLLECTLYNLLQSARCVSAAFKRNVKKKKSDLLNERKSLALDLLSLLLLK